MLVWCYSECISTPGRPEKYAWPRWEFSNRLLWVYIHTRPARCGYTLRVTSHKQQTSVFMFCGRMEVLFNLLILLYDVQFYSHTSWGCCLETKLAENFVLDLMKDDKTIRPFTPEKVSRDCQEQEFSGWLPWKKWAAIEKDWEILLYNFIVYHCCNLPTTGPFLRVSCTHVRDLNKTLVFIKSWLIFTCINYPNGWSTLSKFLWSQ
jgi:hypothetical protein